MIHHNVRIPVLLDTATYIAIAMMSLLGITGFDSLRLQLAALGLCLLFGIFYHFHLRVETFVRNPHLYFGAQAFILTLVFSLGSTSTDAFNFLFLILTIHTALVLPGKAAVIWISIYYVIVSSVVLFTRGADGIYAVVFYLIAYILCGFFGYGLQQAELARDKNQKLLDELQVTQQKLQELAVLEERNRLARDLHDSVKQQVFAISMQLSAARTALSETDEAYTSVAEAEKLAQQAGTELTTLINALRPPGLENKTLANAIHQYAEEWSRQNKIETEIKVDPGISGGMQMEQALFRVLQEALANVARHSKAGKTWVTLASENNHVTLTVRDNGIGYDPTRIKKGVGLDSMQERLAALGGTLEVSSHREASPRDQSQGTTVYAVVRSS
jgi:signal transduction histidine kinase